MRLIDADALEKHIADSFGYPAVDILHEIANFPTVDAVEVVRELWTPVSKQLPGKGNDYLCRCIIDGNNDFPFYMVLRYILIDENPHFQHESAHGLRVTHWMEIPTVPAD